MIARRVVSKVEVDAAVAVRDDGGSEATREAYIQLRRVQTADTVERRRRASRDLLTCSPFPHSLLLQSLRPRVVELAAVRRDEHSK